MFGELLQPEAILGLEMQRMVFANFATIYDT